MSIATGQWLTQRRLHIEPKLGEGALASGRRAAGAAEKIGDEDLARHAAILSTGSALRSIVVDAPIQRETPP